MNKKQPVLAAVLALSACGGSEAPPHVFRLVDSFSSAVVEGKSASLPTFDRTEWRFDGSGSPGRWASGPGVAALSVREGRLVGRSSSDFPMIHLEGKPSADATDILHEIVVNMKGSKAGRLWVTLLDGEKVDFPAIEKSARMFPWPFSIPVIPGESLETYTLREPTGVGPASYPASRIRHVLVRPADSTGADFEIESVRLVFRREHLAAIPSGVSWQGLSDIYRETIVTRSPEEARFELTLPDKPLLDLALGTVEEGAVRFRVSVRRKDDAEARTVLAKTLTTTNCWEEISVDLGEFARQSVALSLSVEAERDGTLGFWGAPAIWSRGARPVLRVEADRDAPRGVVLILIDTLRADHLKAYGYERETAPTLTRLAAEGALFRDVISQGVWTKVSMPSILTSMYPTSLGVVELNDRISAAATTLAESLREGGYATWASSSVPFSGRMANLHQGVEVLHERASIEVPEGYGSKTARALVDRLLPWLDRHHEVPFFVFLHVMDPHSPYKPYPPHDTRWSSPQDLREHEASLEKVRPFIKSDFMRRQGTPDRAELVKAGVDPEAFVRRQLQGYDGSIRGADVEVARVLEKLQELGIEQDTLVVVTSDHGEEFLDHGGSFHEENVYGELTNVPLLMRLPGVIPPGAVVPETVQLLDLMPTILDLCRLPAPETAQGRSLAPLLLRADKDADGGWRRRPAITEWTRRLDQRESDIVDATSIIVDGFKLIHNVHRPEGRPEFELYDHQKDPLDKNDVAAPHPDVVARLSKQLASWREWAQARRLSQDAAVEGLSQQELERLRSLGYIQ
jgi:arylsulfatase A-like enzyme